jgi:DNA-binding transcriptional ArsR family regulator
MTQARFWTDHKAIVLFPEERLIAVPSQGRYLYRQWNETSLPMRVIFALLERPLSLKDIHAQRSSSSYEAYRHASMARTLLSRARAELQLVGLKVDYSSELEQYRIASPLEVLSVRFLEIRSRGRKRAPERLRQIEEWVRRAGEIGVSELCRHFGVSRQALNPHLQQLVANSKIILVRKGPQSYYRWRPRSKSF